MVLPRTFGYGTSIGAVGACRRVSRSGPSYVAVLGVFNVAELAAFDKEMISAASPSRVGDMENSTSF